MEPLQPKQLWFILKPLLIRHVFMALSLFMLFGTAGSAPSLLDI